MEKFTELGLNKEIVQVIRESGFKEPSKIQVKAIPLALAGRDIIGGSSTGSGKTLVFASPIIENLKPEKNVQALILTPTRELAEQVSKSIKNFSKNKKLNVLPIYGGINIEPQIRKIYTADVIVGTPGRILDHLERGTLNLNNVKFLVLDEVDRMFDMGFSKDVEKIIKQCPAKRQTMMFSATVSQDIDYLAKKYTNKPVEISVESQVDPRKLTQFYYDVPDNKKFSLLVKLLEKEDSGLVMVFCSTRRNVDTISNNLLKQKINAKAIHGGIEQKKRMRVMDEFHNNKTGVLVCTDVAARGLDIKGVSHVYNYDVPEDAKDYIHRIGRTARAGKQGKAITILASRDYENFRNLNKRQEFEITQKDLPQIQNIRIEMITFRRRNNNDNNRGNNNRSRNNNNRRESNNRTPGRNNNNRRWNDNPGRRWNDNEKSSNNRRSNFSGRTNNFGHNKRRDDNRRTDTRRSDNRRNEGRWGNRKRDNNSRRSDFSKRRRY
jgi:ATP-dependent RNA helicase DeaD